MPSHEEPPCLSAPGIQGPKYAKAIKIKPMIGRVGPTLRRVASRVSNNKAEPMNTSDEDGLPTRCAKDAAGKSGRYIAAPIASNAKKISIRGTPSNRCQAFWPSVSLLRMPKRRNTSPRTNER